MTKSHTHSSLYLVAFVLVFFGTGTPTLRAAESSVDTASLMSINLDTYDADMTVRSVTEDGEYYYVEYGYDTIEVVEASWQHVPKVVVMKIPKEELGKRDLGLYVTDQLGQIARQHVSYLKEVQEQEKNKEKSRETASEYSGLIGQSLDVQEKTLGEYEPVKPPVEEVAPVVAVVGSGDVAVSPSVETPAAEPAAIDELTSKISVLETKLQALTELVSALSEFYSTFDLGTFLTKRSE